MVVLQNDDFGRLLHNALYKRLVAFAEKYTPELPAEAIVELWLRAFFDQHNKGVHILVDYDKQYNITAHCIILVGQEAGYTICYMHQCQDDKKSGVFLDECFEYFDKLATNVNAVCNVATAIKGVKALEKKYNYTASRTLIYKSFRE